MTILYKTGLTIFYITYQIRYSIFPSVRNLQILTNSGLKKWGIAKIFLTFHVADCKVGLEEKNLADFCLMGNSLVH